MNAHLDAAFCERGDQRVTMGMPDDVLVVDVLVARPGSRQHERGPGELRIHLTSTRLREPRPFTLVEAGTGDLETNFFRGTFLHPSALGGALGGALERIDTRGTDGRETGHRLGAWLRYGIHFRDDLGVAAEVRRTRRDIATDAFPVGISRTDWVVRGRGLFLGERLTAELFTGGSSSETEEEELIVPVERSRSQHGVRLALDPGPAWVRGTLRVFGGPDAPAHALEVEGGVDLPTLGGAFGRLSSEDWSGTRASLLDVHAWTVPRFGLSAFASWSDGVRGARILPPYRPLPPETEEGPPPPPPEELESAQRFTDVTTMRVGGSFSWRPLQLHGAWLRTESGSLPPLELELDRGSAVLAGGTFTGWEGVARLELPVEGFALTGAYQTWDAEARYLPRRLYQGGLEFHDTFLDSRNLEVWGALGVEGRDPMLVPPVPGEETVPVRVPFYQSWNADVQVRILTVHLFIRWDNFTLRPQNQDVPGRRLPTTRAVYGVKWVLWN